MSFDQSSPTPSIPVSVCILVKNEAENLARCLNRLGPFAEIIVQDTGSTDSSLAICSKYPVTIYQEPWVDFSHNRNLLFKKATQPWILWLDADEVVSDSLLENITDFLRNCSPEDSGAQINRMVHFEGQWIRHGHWFPNWNGRLFRSDRWLMPARRVHERIELTHGRWKKINGTLEHYSFRNWQDYAARSEKYARLWAEQRAIEGKTSRPLDPWLHAVWAFVQGYILKKGILDGPLGFKLSLQIAKETHRKYSLLIEENNARA
jgi:glycosyltransferase involved in cell wall biosynthesis